MNETEFLSVARRAYDSLPREFRDAVGNLVIQTPDWPSPETLEALNIESPYDLLGLYHGVGLPFKSVSDIPLGPDMIQLYRLPIFAYASDHGETVDDVIVHVLIHEIGHHFGFSDDDMDAIEANV